MAEFNIPAGFPVGVSVVEILTGLEGRVGGYLKRENGCVQVLLMTAANKKNKRGKDYYFDAPLLELTDTYDALEGIGKPDLPLMHDIGDQVYDPITEFEGVVTEITLAANGCFDCRVSSKGSSLLGNTTTQMFDHRRLEKKKTIVTDGNGAVTEEVAPNQKSRATSSGCAPISPSDL
jgi:hypothetical protein